MNLVVLRECLFSFLSPGIQGSLSSWALWMRPPRAGERPCRATFYLVRRVFATLAGLFLRVRTLGGRGGGPSRRCGRIIGFVSTGRGVRC